MADELLEHKDELLVRIYNVGLGDCIYVRVPDKGKYVHMLIDCGNKFGEMKALEDAIKNVENNLPREDPNDPSSKKVLDLLVVTHPHEDHHKGFEPDYFKNIRIKNLWLSPAFRELDKALPGTGISQLSAMQADAESALNRLIEASPAGEVQGFLKDVLLSLSKSDAISVLNGGTKEGPPLDGVKLDVVKRRYISSDFRYPLERDKDFPIAGNEDQFAKAQQDQFAKDLEELFGPNSETKIKVLGPIGNIATYLSKPKQGFHGAKEIQDREIPGGESNTDGDQAKEVVAPKNISAQDFDRLRAGIQGNVLTAAGELGHAVNNLSVVLLLEWKGYRLLFPGDAEWDGSQIEKLKDANNGSWNVMWNDDKDGELKKRIHFLKVGHHGSENATPWARTPKGEDHPINVILNGLLPEPQGNEKPTALAVVSTQEVTKWPTIPDPELLRAIGKRVANVRAFGKDLRFEHDDREKYKIYIKPNEPAELIPLPARTDQKNWEKPKNANEAPKELLPAAWIDVFFPAP